MSMFVVVILGSVLKSVLPGGITILVLMLSVVVGM